MPPCKEDLQGGIVLLYGAAVAGYFIMMYPTSSLSHSPSASG